ncbi:MAG: metal-sulfur cluster assembly factor [Gemmatimonadota bacterium]|nr:metal-sulfur cluster assembly factor [Gemmatimonadota bacterium]MDE2870378.1 metal-sulfur cluster assembly factor [Gemmatimonadota bacterium]
MAELNGRAGAGVVGAAPPRRRRLKTLLAEQPAPRIHASGGRDRWSAPLPESPADKSAALHAALGEVLDPELPISLVELGLVYGVGFEGGTARVDLTFTATACPCMDFIKRDVRDRIGSEPWVKAVEINEVWDPPWTTDRISEAGRRKLAGLGVGA